MGNYYNTGFLNEAITYNDLFEKRYSEIESEKKKNISHVSTNNYNTFYADKRIIDNVPETKFIKVKTLSEMNVANMTLLNINHDHSVNDLDDLLKTHQKNHKIYVHNYRKLNFNSVLKWLDLSSLLDTITIMFPSIDLFNAISQMLKNILKLQIGKVIHNDETFTIKKIEKNGNEVETIVVYKVTIKKELIGNSIWGSNSCDTDFLAAGFSIVNQDLLAKIAGNDANR